MRPWLRLLSIVLLVNGMLCACYIVLRVLSVPAIAPIASVQAVRVVDYAAALGWHDQPVWPETSMSLPIQACSADCDRRFLVLRVPLPATDATGMSQDWAIFLPFFNEDVQVLYSGRRLRPLTVMANGSVNRHSPTLLVFQRQPDQVSERLDVVVRAGSGHWQVLSAIYVAPAADLAKAGLWAQVLGRKGHRAAILLCLPFLGLALGLAWRVGDRRLHRVFALAVLGWIGTTVNLFMPAGVLSSQAHTWIYMGGALLAVCMVPRFADALISNDEPRFGRGFLWVLWLGLLVMTLVIYLPGLHWATRIALPSLILQGTVVVSVGYVLWRFARYAKVYVADPIAPWVVAFLVALCWTGLYDAVYSASNWLGIWEVSLAPFGLLFLALAYALDVVRQVYRNHLLAQDHVRTLEAAVQAREAELEAQFARMRAVERSEVLGRERRRIMQDMHDGVAGSLASLLVTARVKSPSPEELLTAIADSLSDLRLIIDALGADDDDLTVSLGRLRARLEPAFRDSGIALHWRIDPRLEHSLAFGPRATLQIYRWVQEAVNNAIRHSACTAISVSLHASEHELTLAVADNGRGFMPDLASAGMGLASLQERAQAVGARLQVGNGAEGGAQLQLLWPLPADTAATT